ncbi:envelope glycoprotein B [Panine betaherpesvirus 2]|uniref:Envelope glycoprotein B n=1 Tax=Panine betaherpesvirus 2 TaxID=188763 RepID=Q8QS33_9BETA|nr:envelope glycoprotein B [Panine betaherpesvirus 2]AAM00705.1 envelope glycoprotein B [Panine betaherpesvirus 2]QXV67810.1 envelope glycoprotein B [Panine betaherpesvirus 2]
MWAKIWCLVVCVSLLRTPSSGGVYGAPSSSSTSGQPPTPSVPGGSSSSGRTTTRTTQQESTTNGTEYIFNTTLRPDDVIGVNISKYPYRVCSMAQGTDLIRFDRNIHCTSVKPTKEDLDEGMMVVYKRNIQAHTFKVRVFQKVLTFRRSYAYIYSTYLLGSNTEYVPPPMWEVHFINNNGQCYNSYSKVMGDTVFVAYHEDSYENKTMKLIPDDYSNTHSTRYVTVKEQYHTRGSTWLYRETCSLNCMVTVTTARSKYPYHFFATSTGDVVDISPFYNKTNGKYFGENADKFYLIANYSMVEDYGQWNSHKKTHKLVAFLERGDSVLSWDVEDEQNTTCQYAYWESSDRTIRAETHDSLHFTSSKMTATFLSKKTPVNISDPGLACIKDKALTQLETMFNSSYNETYVKHGKVEVFETTGGLVVFWQGIKQKSLADLEDFAKIQNETLERMRNGTRHKRDTSTSQLSYNSTDVIHNVMYAQLQFTYDTLRNYINKALAQIAEAWCVDQRRTLEVFKELSKINPSAILSAIYDKPIAARFMGDVLGLAQCVNINQTSVKVLRDMHTKEKGRCYSRPVVMFTFVNSSHVQYGQLGEDNEILLGNHRTEECQLPSLKIFIAGNSSYEYVDYMFKRMIDLSTIATVDSMIALDINPLENTDFRALELYSQQELRSSNVFDLEDIMREFNSYKQRVKYVEDKVVNPLPPYLKGLDDLMSGLGSAGKAVGTAIGAVGGAVASVVEGVAAFLKNPFGAFTIILVALAVLVIIYLIYTRQRRMYMQPLEQLFPYMIQSRSSSTTVTSTSDAPSSSNQAPPSYEDSVYNSGHKSATTSVQPYTTEQAFQMLLALQRLDAQHRPQKHKGAPNIVVAPSAPPMSRDNNGASSEDNSSNKKQQPQQKPPKPNLLDRIRHRKNGYQHLGSEEDV